ncbi:hypothetical protein PVAND_007834 [Polypedilum vanderplanki]|uniref:Uncharacterized protein n=1 Tax=Polypedilum vanderplanki TaxID=319348 RepID=A0A9J6C8E1_POLVA|nr:hypothetical protein PVAND_007834 [Polypedilum vanderplanki]
MEKYIVFFIISFLIASIHGSSESSSSEEKDKKAVSMYQELYCQTEFVLKEKLIQAAENSENGFKILAGDNIDQLDCQPVLEKSKQKIYHKLRKEHKSKKYLKKSADCNIKKFQEHGYDKLRFKSNSLLGLDLPTATKNELRSQINKEIAEIIEKSVDECSMNPTTTTDHPIDVRGEFSTINNVPNIP